MNIAETSISAYENREQQIVDMLYDNARGAFMGSMFNILLVSFVLYNISPTMTLATWTIAGVLLNLVRWLNYASYVAKPQKHSLQRWLTNHRVLTFLSGCLYGILAVFFFDTSQPEYQALIIFLVGGMGAAAVGTYAIDLKTYYLFLYSSVGPLIVRSVVEQSQIYITLAIMLVTLVLVMRRSAKQTHKVLHENFQLNESLKYRATHDSLVGLLNREEFHNQFVQDQRAKNTSNNTLAMIFIDLDNFKTLNDTFGHQAGDDTLITISNIIRTSIRKDDIAARFGGDEFMILLRSHSIEAAQTVATKIMGKLEEFKAQFKDREHCLGASIGIGYSADPSVDFELLLRTADQACYDAKNQGKGKVCIKKAEE